MTDGSVKKSFPVKGTGCGIRPDVEELGEDTAFNFADAKAIWQQTQADQHKETDQHAETIKKKHSKDS